MFQMCPKRVPKAMEVITNEVLNPSTIGRSSLRTRHGGRFTSPLPPSAGPLAGRIVKTIVKHVQIDKICVSHVFYGPLGPLLVQFVVYSWYFTMNFTIAWLGSRFWCCFVRAWFSKSRAQPPKNAILGIFLVKHVEFDKKTSKTHTC